MLNLDQVHDGHHLGDGDRWDGDHYDLECENQRDEYWLESETYPHYGYDENG